MCNLYSMTRSREAIARLFRVDRDQTGNQPALPAIFPNQLAPAIRQELDGARTMLNMRWGFPCPPGAGNGLVTNVRNTGSAYWRGWLKPEFRCLVPATSFCEYTDSAPKVPHWFALGPEREPFAFAGIWRPWTGTRGTKAAPEEGEHLLFAFLTTEANEVVRPVHGKAMPVILTGGEWETWLTSDLTEAIALQKPARPGLLTVVAKGERQDSTQLTV
jgi:putative SOS response-associated peptidase YedK